MKLRFFVSIFTFKNMHFYCKKTTSIVAHPLFICAIFVQTNE